MAYNYSNPFQPAGVPQSIPQQGTSQLPTLIRTSVAQSFQILFGGLPPDVRENSLKELFADPKGLGLSPSATSITMLFDGNGDPLGKALISVNSDTLAEKIRRMYSGQQVDSDKQIEIQHILAVNKPLPNPLAAVIPAREPAKSPPTQPRVSTVVTKQQVKTPVQQSSSKAKPAAAPNNKAPGLALLNRLGKPGAGKPAVLPVPINTKGMTPREKQIAIMAAQKAAQAPGQALLHRLAKPIPTRTTSTSVLPPSKTGAPTRQPISRASAKPSPNGLGKIGRAKEKAAKAKSTAMKVDDEGVGKQGGKKVVKTQEELDEEMRVYERARRFGVAA